MATRKPQFHAFTTTYQGLSNRILTAVKLCEAFDPNNPPSPYPTLHETKALWDTGATKSVVTQATAQALGLIPTGTATVQHAGGSSQSNTYVVNFILPNKVLVRGVLVTECPSISGNVGAIIGMDIITQGDFSITNVNRCTCVSYRYPSIKTIDYVKEGRRLAFAGVGRNDLCPCGSGKKFKKCHGSPQAQWPK